MFTECSANLCCQKTFYGIHNFTIYTESIYFKVTKFMLKILFLLKYLFNIKCDRKIFVMQYELPMILR